MTDGMKMRRHCKKRQEKPTVMRLEARSRTRRSGVDGGLTRELRASAMYTASNQEGFSTGLMAPGADGGGGGEGGGRRAASMPTCDPASDFKAAIAVVTGSKLNILLVFCPLGMAAEPAGFDASVIFFLNFLVRATGQRGTRAWRYPATHCAGVGTSII